MERMLLSSAGEWARRGIECDILSTTPEPGSWAPHLAAAGYRIHHFPFRSEQSGGLSLGALQAFYRLCRERKYAVVHIHTEAAAPVYAVLAKGAGIPRIALTVHNTFRFEGWLRLRKALERRFVRLLGGRYGMVSESVAQCEQDRFGNRGIRLLNWLDVDQFRPPTRGERDAAREQLRLSRAMTALLTIGNCNAAKNHGDLLAAMHLLNDRSDLIYLHVGREEEGFPERALANRLGVAEKIRFCGSHEDVRTYLWACDVFVMPSRNEGLAVAALEAIAAGCCAIFFEVPGLLDLKPLAPGAVFVPPDAQLLAASIERLVSITPGLGPGCREDSAAIRSRFSPERGVGVICEELYGMAPAPEGPVR